ncbi:MAG TPA: hypothetical protein VK540_19065 [Polyangiaceae bacterium]|nr:hypothetical protein [Polyangiaceae bacterium]
MLISLGATSNAAGAPEGPRIVYRGPAVCPDGIAFLERVRSRTPRAELAHDGEPARFVVTVTASEGESSGRVELTSHRSEPVVRKVFGKTCDEVVSAAALITALAIEATLDADTDSPKPPAREDNEKMASADAAPVTEKPGDSVRWGAGITGGWDSWSAPSGAYTMGAFGEMTGAAPLRIVRLGLRGATGSTSIGDRSAAFTLLAGKVSLCPVSLALGSRLELAPCVGIDVGQLGGKGEQSASLAEPQSAAIFWSAAEAGFLFRWQAAGFLALEAQAALGFPLVRHSFIFEGPMQLIYDVPAIGAGAGVGAAVRFH